jgi:AhpD family alkylhydroperoxidase
MSERVNLGKASPEYYQAVIGLEKVASAAFAATDFTPGFPHLLRLRASQINQCAYCLRMHTRDALAKGESSDRISVLPGWPETDYFNEKEQAALALTEAITLISDGQLPDEVYENVSEFLSSEEIAAVEMVAITINAWNRIAIASRYPVAPEGV